MYDLIARLGADNVAVLLGAFHMSVEEADPPRAMREAARRCGASTSRRTTAACRAWATLDFGACVALLRTLRYDGFVSAEVAQEPTLVAAARQTVTVVRPLVPRGAAQRSPA